jgi:hypothetical protein
MNLVWLLTLKQKYTSFTGWLLIKKSKKQNPLKTMDTNDRSVSCFQSQSERLRKNSKADPRPHIKQSIKRPFQAFGIKVHTKIPQSHINPHRLFQMVWLLWKWGEGRSLKLCPSTNKPETDLKQLDPSWVWQFVMPEKEVSGAALKWWDEHMHSYAHNFHLAL